MVLEYSNDFELVNFAHAPFNEYAKKETIGRLHHQIVYNTGWINFFFFEKHYLHTEKYCFWKTRLNLKDPYESKIIFTFKIDFQAFSCQKAKNFMKK